MKYKFDYSEEKNLILKEVRAVGFEQIINAINKGDLLDDIDHFNNKKYPNQRIFIVKINHKVYTVPYVKDKVKDTVFLKTIYPNRVLKKKYLR